MAGYKGKYRIRKPDKYAGDPNKITYRSLWEKSAFKYAEDNDQILRWNSEEIIIPYLCQTDNRIHKYHTDLYLEYADGRIVIVEIKPKKETKPPIKKANKKQATMLRETFTWAKNQSKWKQAAIFCKKKGWIFEIWTEDTLKSKGIRILHSTSKKLPKKRRASKKKSTRKKKS